MTISDKLLVLNTVKQNIKQAIIDKGVAMEGVPFTEYHTKILEISGGETPSTGSQSFFTGATIPLTYKDNTHEKENNYEYKSSSYNITITGLDGRATITGNGTKEVLVSFDVSSDVSSLKNFTITLTKGNQTLTYKGLHAHYGENVTGVLTFAYTNIMPDGSEGTIGTNYKFIESNDEPVFSTTTTNWNSIYSYQVLNILVGNITSIGNYFLSFSYSFNQPLDLSNITSIGNYFLNSCHAFNQPLDLSNTTSIGTYFLYYCYSFNQPLDLSNITSIGNYFLNNCDTFNQPLDLSNITSIGNDFLSYCQSFNQPLDLSNITSIGHRFLNYCYTFNQPLDLSNITIIREDFLQYCRSFNQPLDLSNITSIGMRFLSSCFSFNQLLDLSNTTSIGNDFLSYCYTFNQPLDLSNITSIGNGFLTYCRSFNQLLDLSNITSIGGSFLRDCYSFNQPLDLSNITSIGNYFLNNCYSVSTITWNANVFPTDNNSLSQNVNSKTHSTNGEGIKVYGSKRLELIAALPDRTSSPYRKLIDGGS